MLWLALYIAAMFGIALPVALLGRSQVSAAVFVVWGVGQVAYQLGAPEPGTQVLIYGVAFAYVWAGMVIRPHDWSGRCVLAGGMFAPLMLTSMGWALGNFSEMTAWWTIYALAVAQVALLTRPIRWARAAFRWATSIARVWFDHISMVVA